MPEKVQSAAESCEKTPKCPECIRTPAVTLTCCSAGLKFCKECAGDAPEYAPLVASHECFTGRHAGVCEKCHTGGLARVNKVRCCDIILCDICCGEWYREAHVGEPRCPKCRCMMHVTTSRPFIVVQLVCGVREVVQNRSRALLRSTAHISNAMLRELSEAGLSAMDMMKFFTGAVDKNLMETSPLPVIPGHLLEIQTYSWADLVRNLEDPHVGQCTSGVCMSRRIRGWTAECGTMRALMPLGYESAAMASAQRACVLCLIARQEDVVSQLVVDACAHLDPPKERPFFMCLAFGGDVRMDKVSVAQMTTFLVDFKGNLGGYHPSWFYRAAQFLAGVEWIEGKVSCAGLRRAAPVEVRAEAPPEVSGEIAPGIGPKMRPKKRRLKDVEGARTVDNLGGKRGT
nr:Zn-binding-like protein [Salmonid herpesvirus 1]